MGSRYLTTDGQLMNYTFVSQAPSGDGQVLQSQSGNLIWGTASSGVQVDGTEGQIAVATAAGVATVSIVEAPTVAGKLTVTGSLGVLAEKFTQQTGETTTIDAFSGTAMNTLTLIVGDGTSAHKQAVYTIVEAKIFNQHILTADWNLFPGGAILEGGFINCTLTAPSAFLQSTDIPKDETTSPFVDRNIFLGLIPVVVYSVVDDALGALVGTNTISVSIGPGSDANHYTFYFTLAQPQTAGTPMDGINTFATDFAYRFASNGGITDANAVPAITTFIWT